MASRRRASATLSFASGACASASRASCSGRFAVTSSEAVQQAQLSPPPDVEALAACCRCPLVYCLLSDAFFPPDVVVLTSLVLGASTARRPRPRLVTMFDTLVLSFLLCVISSVLLAFFLLFVFFLPPRPL
ncbi:hypothetical protein MTO96_020978 [Rhipicephalus appendiculatus]